MEEASVWFRASIGRRKNAEARWLLPMICRRGGIDKHDIGAIKILDTTTEFEIAARVADSFAVKIKRPDKEDTIRIEPLADAPQRQAPSDKPARKPRHDSWRDKDDGGHSAPRRVEPRDEAAAKRRGKPDREA